MRITALAVSAALVLATAANAGQVVTGRVSKVRDADTVVVQGVPIRLNGVDAPENKTRAGRDATAAMTRMCAASTHMRTQW